MCGFACSQEVIEQAPPIGKRPVESLKGCRGEGHQRESKFHDIVEREQEADIAPTPLAPPPDRAERHWIEMTPSTARHSAG